MVGPDESMADTFERPKDNLEMALYLLEATRVKLTDIQWMIVNDDELPSFENRRGKKTREILRIVKNKVVVKKVSEFRIVDFSRDA